MNKKNYLQTLCCAAVLSAGFAAMASAETLRLSTLKQPGSDGAIAAQHFADLVSEKTDGELTVKVYPGSQLGDWTEVYEQVIEGAVDIAMQPLATSSDKRLAITWFPYAYSDYDTARVALAPGGSVFEIVKEVIGEQGLTPLAVYGSGMGGAGFPTEVNDPYDLDAKHDLKVRVWPGGTTHKVLLENLGYHTAAVPFSELYTAMQTGVVDGQIGVTATITLENFADITKTWIQYNDHFESDFIFMNSDSFNNLSPEFQDAIREAAEQVSNEQFIAVEAADEASLQKMRDMGVTVVTYDKEQLEAIADRVRSQVWPEIKDELGDETYEALRSALNLN
ncbi:TRAP transporter substrate-binding protein DctP [Celeribacter halophilus]|jgi:TRAP-type C4-dicarboxylate transport system substrate-binding protein|uniref:TRAP transporter substrate-binding protein DctP n=1 Tax=Celeribacter halophilus TaxID=576117 RepID=UPI001C09B192|nr:TRAP transporter substrate-binding protein DctP [Celeribacter halophilus]MBU2888149.1 TRAP transporter substrate-binding protein DctP [Celeribacter halophilus]MDO6512116.1 TRAP transporter substrate-binding protein DctP [Celeribacter halophilus]